jgi:hypothetical protein
MGWVVFHAQVAWIPHLLFLSISPPALSVGFLSPLPFFRCFFFPSGCWVAFGLVDFTVCTFDVLVGGAAKVVVFLAVVCCIDNCCNYFVNCLAGFVCVEPTIPSACGLALCLVLSSIEHGTSGKMLYNKPD